METFFWASHSRNISSNARLIACSCDYLPGSTQPSSPTLRRHPAVRALGGRGMVLVRVRLVLGPLGPVPARGHHAHLRPPSRQKNTKSVTAPRRPLHPLLFPRVTAVTLRSRCTHYFSYALQPLHSLAVTFSRGGRCFCPSPTPAPRIHLSVHVNGHPCPRPPCHSGSIPYKTPL